MADKTIFGCAETGTYQTSAPNPHIDLSGTASSSYSIAQLFADAMSTDETATVSIIKDKDNWAVYGGAKFTNDTVDTLDLSVATLLESKGTLSDEDSVTCLGLAPGQRGTSAARVYRSTAVNSPSNTTVKFAFNAISFDSDNIWDQDNYRFIPKKPGYYIVNSRFMAGDAEQINIIVYKNGAIYSTINTRIYLTTTLDAVSGTCFVYCNGSTDYIEIYIYTLVSKAVSYEASDTWAEIIGPI